MGLGAAAMVGGKMVWQRTGVYPQRWSEMAIDFKLAFALHIAVMIQFMLGRSLTIAIEAGLQAVLVAAALVVAILFRKQSGWHWSGAGVTQHLGALLSLGLTALFLGAVTPMAPPTTPQIFPWYMGGLQIGLFNSLTSIRIARMAQSDFLADCNPAPPTAYLATKGSRETGWRLWARRVYSVAFLAIWLEMVAFFYFHGVTFRNGAPSPNANMNAAMTEHGHTVYVTSAALGRDQILLAIGTIGVPVVLVSGALLHFVFRIRVYGNAEFSGRSGGS